MGKNIFFLLSQYGYENEKEWLTMEEIKELQGFESPKAKAKLHKKKLNDAKKAAMAKAKEAKKADSKKKKSKLEKLTKVLVWSALLVTTFTTLYGTIMAIVNNI
jgi:hypothetical protein